MQAESAACRADIVDKANMPKHQRLRSARVRAGFKTAREAAGAIGVPYGTYSGHEAGSRGIKDEELQKYADAFNVSVSWLAFGEEETVTKSQRFVIVSGCAGRRSDGMVEFYTNDQIEVMPVQISADIVDRSGNIVGHRNMPLAKFIAPAIEPFVDFMVIKIDGNKLHKYFEEDSVLYFQNEKYQDIKGFSHADCICWTESGLGFIAKPVSNLLYNERIVAVSPLVLQLSRMGQSLWLEKIAANFMRAAKSIKQRNA